MNFLNSSALWFLAGLPILLLVLIYNYHVTFRFLVRLRADEKDGSLVSSFARRKIATAITLVMAYVCLVLALAAPVWGDAYDEEDRKGREVMVILDVSRSMLANDLKPDRLSRARETLYSLLSEQGSDARTGLILTKGTSVVEVPLTADSVALLQTLQYAGTKSVASTGTDIGAAIRLALSSFPGGTSAFRSILLATDGDQLGTDAVAAAREASMAGVPLIVIGFGTKVGGNIPLADGSIQKNSDGSPLLCRMNADQLQVLADTARGQFLEAGEVQSPTRVFQSVKAFLWQQEHRGYRLHEVPRHDVFLTLALCLLALALGVRVFPSRWTRP